MRIESLETEFLCPDDEKGGAFGDRMKSLKIEITAIENVKGSEFQNEVVQDIDVLEFSVGHSDKTRDIASEIEKRMEFDGTLRLPKLGPRKKRKAKIDRGGIERISGLVEFRAKGFVSVKFSCSGNQDVSKVAVDTPVSGFVRFGKRASRHFAADSHVIEFHLQGPETRFDISKTFSIGQLSKGHRKELIET